MGGVVSVCLCLGQRTACGVSFLFLSRGVWGLHSAVRLSSKSLHTLRPLAICCFLFINNHYALNFSDHQKQQLFSYCREIDMSATWWQFLIILQKFRFF